MNQRVMTPWLFMAFRLFSLTGGRFQTVADRIKRILVEVLVRRRRTVPMALRRTITLHANSLRSRTRNVLRPGLAVETVTAGDKFATIHMGSSRYFQGQELATRRDGCARRRRRPTLVRGSHTRARRSGHSLR